MARAWVAAIVVAAIGCEPGFPLPTVQAPTPDPNGPCLQTRRLRKHSWIWNKGVAQTSVADATVDDPDAHALARRARTLDRLAVSSALAGIAFWWTGVLLVALLPTRDEQLGVGVGSGTLAVGGWVGAVVSSIRSAHDRDRAIEVYNQNCRR